MGVIEVKWHNDLSSPWYLIGQLTLSPNFFCRGTVHPDNLSYATKGKKVNLSTCSQVIDVDIEETLFETSQHLNDVHFSMEEVDAIVEHPCLSKETVSTIERPKILSVQTVEVKIY